MLYNSFFMGILLMVLLKNIFFIRFDGINFRDGIIKRRRLNLKEIDMVYNFCRIFKKNIILVCLNDKILRLCLCIGIVCFV